MRIILTKKTQNNKNEGNDSTIVHRSHSSAEIAPIACRQQQCASIRHGTAIWAAIRPSIAQPRVARHVKKQSTNDRVETHAIKNQLSNGSGSLQNCMHNYSQSCLMNRCRLLRTVAVAKLGLAAKKEANLHASHQFTHCYNWNRELWIRPFRPLERRRHQSHDRYSSPPSTAALAGAQVRGIVGRLSTALAVLLFRQNLKSSNLLFDRV